MFVPKNIWIIFNIECNIAIMLCASFDFLLKGIV